MARGKTFHDTSFADLATWAKGASSGYYAIPVGGVRMLIETRGGAVISEKLIDSKGNPLLFGAPQQIQAQSSA